MRLLMAALLLATPVAAQEVVVDVDYRTMPLDSLLMVAHQDTIAIRILGERVAEEEDLSSLERLYIVESMRRLYQPQQCCRGGGLVEPLIAIVAGAALGVGLGLLFSEKETVTINNSQEQQQTTTVITRRRIKVKKPGWHKWPGEEEQDDGPIDGPIDESQD